jgi:hypothetical protein
MAKNTTAVFIPRYERFAGISGSIYEIDSPLEFALLSHYSQPVVNIRPIEAKNMLPANNSKQAGLKLGTAVYMDLQAARFTGSDPAPRAAALKFITVRARRAEAHFGLACLPTQRNLSAVLRAIDPLKVLYYHSSNNITNYFRRGTIYGAGTVCPWH